MEFNFSIGIIVGIVMGIIGMNVVSPKDEPAVSKSKPAVQTTTRIYHSSCNNYDDYDNYANEDFGLHERGF